MNLEPKLTQILANMKQADELIGKLSSENESLRKENNYLKLEAESSEKNLNELDFTAKKEMNRISDSDLKAFKKDIEGYVVDIDKSIAWLKSL